MLQAIGAPSLDALMAEIVPSDIRRSGSPRRVSHSFKFMPGTYSWAMKWTSSMRPTS